MKFLPRSTLFARQYMKLSTATEQVQGLYAYVELRRMKNGVQFYIDHLHMVILVRFPGMEDWIDFEKVRKLGSLKVMQSELLTTLPEARLREVNCLLKFGKGAAK